MSDCGCEIEVKNQQQARVLVISLIISAIFIRGGFQILADTKRGREALASSS